MKFNLNNKVAIVTGASQGIGETIAVEMANSGAYVICLARNKDALDSTINIIEKNGKQAIAYSCDISNNDQFNQIIKSVIEEHEKIDILVNNAGITNDTLLMRMSDEQWDNVLDINLKGSFTSTRSVIKHMMKKRFGRIINITSIVGLTGNAGQANYAASKAGLIGMTKSIAKEVASRGITANCIAPGWIETSMTDELSDDVKNKFLSQIPTGKIGYPKDIANTVIFLASDEAEYITGQTITVDGGRIIKIMSVLQGAISGGNAAITFEIGGTAVTGAGITVAHSGSATGTMDSSVPSALNEVAEDGSIEIITDGNSTGAKALDVTFVIRR